MRNEYCHYDLPKNKLPLSDSVPTLLQYVITYLSLLSKANNTAITK